MSEGPYGLSWDATFAEQLDAAPAAVQAAFRDALGVLLVTPLPGQSSLEVEPLPGWWPDAYVAVLPKGLGLLSYRVPAGSRMVVLLRLTWA